MNKEEKREDVRMHRRTRKISRPQSKVRIIEKIRQKLRNIYSLGRKE